MRGLAPEMNKPIEDNENSVPSLFRPGLIPAAPQGHLIWKHYENPRLCGKGIYSIVKYLSLLTIELISGYSVAGKKIGSSLLPYCAQ